MSDKTKQTLLANVRSAILPQSCTNRAPIQCAQRTGRGGRVSGFFAEIPSASNRASILYQSDEMFSRLELDCRYKAQLTGHPIGPPIECQSCANPVRSVQRTAHGVHCTPRNRATILLRLLPIAVSVSIRSQSCYNLGRLWLDCIISVRNPATIVHQSCTNLVCTAHRAGG